jgi:hypothetical protein
MPLVYIALHLLLSAGCLLLMLYLRPGSRAGLLFCLGVLALVVFGFVLERRLDWGFAVMRRTTPDLPYLTNLSLEGAMALLGLLWQKARENNAGKRAVVLSLPLLAGVLWSYAWYFAPVPSGLTGQADASGYCRQSSEESCSAAAAVMLLHHKGIATTEAEMASLCLTRSRWGTPTLGLCRGLLLKSALYGLQTRLIHTTPEQLSHLGSPCIISVGLSQTASQEVVEKMSEFGWEPGRYHAVVVLSGDAGGQWFDVADPSYGREKWPAEHLKALWNGTALILDQGF